MSAPRPRRAPRGFTLVELLVAVAVLAIVAVLGWRGLDGIVRSRQALTEQMDQTRGAQLAFAQLQSDLEQLASQASLRQRQQLVADATRIDFVRTVFTEGEPSRLQVVSYRIRDGVLLRRESAGTRDLLQLDKLWQAALGDTDPAPDVTLQAGVQAMTTRLWENGDWQPASTPLSSAGVSAAAQPPMSAPAQGGAPVSTGPIGLEWSLQLQNQANPLVKIFLLGAK